MTGCYRMAKSEYSSKGQNLYEKSGEKLLKMPGLQTNFSSK